jgi:hypothetical protein
MANNDTTIMAELSTPAEIQCPEQKNSYRM